MAQITSWDEIDEQMAREAMAISRRFNTTTKIKRNTRSKDTLKPGQAKVHGASGAGEGRKSLGQILQGCR